MPDPRLVARHDFRIAVAANREPAAILQLYHFPSNPADLPGIDQKTFVTLDHLLLDLLGQRREGAGDDIRVFGGMDAQFSHASVYKGIHIKTTKNGLPTY